MEKTYYKNLLFKESKGHWICTFEFSDDSEGFFMPMTFESPSRQEVEDRFYHFIGEESEKV